MKNILVPTDFSACAANATEVAIQLAERYKARVHLFSALIIPPNWNQLSEIERKKYPDPEQELIKAELLMKQWQEKARKRKVELTMNTAGGKLIENIQLFCTAHGVDLIVIGSNGDSGKNEYLIGTNTQRVIRHIHLPILVIKEPVEKFEIKRAVFASNFIEAEKEPFLRFLEFVKHDLPELHLVAIETPGFFNQSAKPKDTPIEVFRQLAAPLHCETHFFRDWNVEAGIRHFSENIGADLIGISNHQRHPLRRILTGSNVEALVNHSQVPVLSVDYINEEITT